MTGSVAGDIVVKTGAFVGFGRGNNIIYPKTISGAGGVRVYQHNNTKAILTGVNIYTGNTYVDAGTLQISNGSSGSIKNSEKAVIANGAKLDISDANQTILGLDGVAGSEVILGSKTLTIGVAGFLIGVDPTGGGNFAGKFSGTGGVIKFGSETFTMSGDNSATGTFQCAEGQTIFSNQWAGNLLLKPASIMASVRPTLEIVGTATVGGTLSLQKSTFSTYTFNPGTIKMNLSGTNPSKLIAANAFTAEGVTKLNISSNANVTNQALIQAASGITSTDVFEVESSNFDGILTATGTQLLISGTVGINEVDAQSLMVYPNPTTGELRITNYDLRIGNVEIFDVYGRMQKSRKAEKQNEIDISDLSSGIYFLKITTEQGTITKKVVKQ
jgi:subtilase-type serine protease